MKNFLNPNQCRYLASLICVLGEIFAFILKIKFGMNSIHPTFIIGILIIIAGFVFGFIKARCPHCNCLLSFVQRAIQSIAQTAAANLKMMIKISLHKFGYTI